MKISIENLTPLIKAHQYEISLGLCALFLAYIIALMIKKVRSNFPPGPMGLPVVGYLPFLTENLHLDFMKLGQKYGDVFSVRLGSQVIVILNGGDAIKEGLNKSELLGRPPNSALEKFSPSSAFFSSHFHFWKEQRRFVVQSMKDLGLGKTKIEEAVMEDLNRSFMIITRHTNEMVAPLAIQFLINPFKLIIHEQSSPVSQLPNLLVESLTRIYRNFFPHTPIFSSL